MEKIIVSAVYRMKRIKDITLPDEWGNIQKIMNEMKEDNVKYPTDDFAFMMTVEDVYHLNEVLKKIKD
ncbi:MAG TPA: hypothetical protein DEF34_02950 [Desulfotomaculum sp.]|nr:MAG: hypothetical protein JL56_02570 [Desulfotomaculum sp. BICA1-6]HBX22585.1 hypothetical protein [Desulfotomaculum sp.]